MLTLYLLTGFALGNAAYFCYVTKFKVTWYLIELLLWIPLWPLWLLLIFTGAIKLNEPKK